MARRLIIDTGILISIKRGKLSTADAYRADDDVAIAAVTVAELIYGAAQAADPRRRADWTEHATAVARVLRVLPYGTDTAIRHGELLAHTRATGTARGALDLVIAAHAAETGRIIITRDRAARFDDLPGVRAVALS